MVFVVCIAVTNVTQWEKPEELKTEADREKEGEWYWVPDEKEAYVPAKKIGGNSYELGTCYPLPSDRCVQVHRSTSN